MKELRESTGVDPEQIDINKVPTLFRSYRMEGAAGFVSALNLPRLVGVLSKSELTPSQRNYVLGLCRACDERFKTISNTRKVLSEGVVIFEDNPDRKEDELILHKLLPTDHSFLAK